MSNESQTAEWQLEVSHHLTDARMAVEANRPDKAISYLTDALDILHRVNCQEQIP